MKVLHEPWMTYHFFMGNIFIRYSNRRSHGCPVQ